MSSAGRGLCKAPRWRGLQELLGARQFQPRGSLVAHIQGRIGGYGVVLLEGRFLELVFFLLSSLGDAGNVCNQVCDSLGRCTARLRC